MSRACPTARPPSAGRDREHIDPHEREPRTRRGSLSLRYVRLPSPAAVAAAVVAGPSVTAAAGRAIRDILWPFTALVTAVEREGKAIVPNGSAVLYEGDVLTVERTPENEAQFLFELRALVGEVLLSETGDEGEGAEPNGENAPPETTEPGQNEENGGSGE